MYFKACHVINKTAFTKFVAIYLHYRSLTKIRISLVLTGLENGPVRIRLDVPHSHVGILIIEDNL